MRAAVDHEHRAVDVARLVGGHEQARARDLLGPRQAAERRELESGRVGEMRIAGRAHAVADHLGVDPARRDTVGAHAHRAVGDRHRAGQVHHAALGGGVGVRVGHAHQAADAGDVDDGAAAARDHHRQRVMADVVHRAQIDGDHVAPALGRRSGDVGHAGGMGELVVVADARVVDHDVEPAELRLGRLDQAACSRSRSRRRPRARSPSPPSARTASIASSSRVIGAPAGDHAGAFASEHLDRGATHAGAAAGDQTRPCHSSVPWAPEYSGPRSRRRRH